MRKIQNKFVFSWSICSTVVIVATAVGRCKISKITNVACESGNDIVSIYRRINGQHFVE